MHHQKKCLTLTERFLQAHARFMRWLIRAIVFWIALLMCNLLFGQCLMFTAGYYVSPVLVWIAAYLFFATLIIRVIAAWDIKQTRKQELKLIRDNPEEKISDIIPGSTAYPVIYDIGQSKTDIYLPVDQRTNQLPGILVLSAREICFVSKSAVFLHELILFWDQIQDAAAMTVQVEDQWVPCVDIQVHNEVKVRFIGQNAPNIARYINNHVLTQRTTIGPHQI